MDLMVMLSDDSLFSINVTIVHNNKILIILKSAKLFLRPFVFFK